MSVEKKNKSSMEIKDCLGGKKDKFKAYDGVLLDNL